MRIASQHVVKTMQDLLVRSLLVVAVVPVNHSTKKGARIVGIYACVPGNRGVGPAQYVESKAVVELRPRAWALAHRRGFDLGAMQLEIDRRPASGELCSQHRVKTLL